MTTVGALSRAVLFGLNNTRLVKDERHARLVDLVRDRSLFLFCLSAVLGTAVWYACLGVGVGWGWVGGGWWGWKGSSQLLLVTLVLHSTMMTHSHLEGGAPFRLLTDSPPTFVRSLRAHQVPYIFLAVRSASCLPAFCGRCFIPYGYFDHFRATPYCLMYQILTHITPTMCYSYLPFGHLPVVPPSFAQRLTLDTLLWQSPGLLPVLEKISAYWRIIPHPGVLNRFHPHHRSQPPMPSQSILTFHLVSQLWPVLLPLYIQSPCSKSFVCPPNCFHRQRPFLVSSNLVPVCSRLRSGLYQRTAKVEFKGLFLGS